MQVRALRNLALPLPPYEEGQVYECDDDVGKALIEAGHVEPAGKPAKAAAAPAEPTKAKAEKAKAEK
jgi:hypothetical protein